MVENGEKKGSRGRLIVLVVVLVVVLAAAFFLMRGEGELGGAMRSVARGSKDAATTAKVKAALTLSKEVSALDIGVDTEEGRVSLVGQVPTIEAKEMAEAIVAGTSGVKELDSRLTVDPEALPDPEMVRIAARVADLEAQAGIQRALLASEDLEGSAVEVTVERGVATLSGAVSSGAQRDLAEWIARGAAGVAEVRNDLEVTESEATPEGADGDLAERAEFELYKTRAFDLSGIEIGAEAGEVTLSGRARSRAEVLLAERVAAEVEGVTSVVNRLLVVEPGEGEEEVPAAEEEGE